LSASALKLANLLPVTTDPCGRIQYGGQNNNEYIADARADYQIERQQSLFAWYRVSWLDQPTDLTGSMR
jgi:hypothetical protein